MEVTENGTDYYNIITSNDSYKTSIGDTTTTSFVITHSLNTKDVIVQLFDTSTFDTVYADVIRNSVNQVTINFTSAPATNDIRVLIQKI